MPVTADLSQLVGRFPDQLSLPERRRFAGAWLAFEVYSPETVPLRRIEAAAPTLDECVAQVASRGNDPRNYEFVPVQPPPAC